ncbi:MAG: DNA mismatch repair endonuclease MutL [Clostridia bacterium]|nr:DNA mismatch repair endonuclease MutL [Clostridia bacterium]
MKNTRIYQLPPEVIGQIAAGEVVERPSAAIKELVENSMDAGATAITVDIKEGGLASFRVTDNGSGIAFEDLRLAFARHATSKIRTAADLFGVKSLGFRGEALASIAAVSKVTCLTRQKGKESGYRVKNEGGVIEDIQDAACPEGTSFTVKELFYNAPVRRKFLKKPGTETAAVSELMARLILSNPGISFRFMADGKQVYFSAGDGNMESAIMAVYGTSTLKQLVRIDGNMNGVMVSGYVGVGDVARGNRSHEHFFLNGRTMKSGILSAAVETACRQRITIGRFPMCILYITMPYENVDVNVHPNKWEVRFADEKAVRSAVETLVFEALEKTNLAPVIPAMFPAEEKPREQQPVIIRDSAPVSIQSVSPQMPQAVQTQATASQTVPTPVPQKAAAPILSSALSAFSEDGASMPSFKPVKVEKEEALTPFVPYLPEKKSFTAKESGSNILPPKLFVQEEKKKETVPPPAKPLEFEQVQEATVEKYTRPSVRIIGVAFNTYILMEYGDLLVLCDQHAVHERLLYERFMRETATAPASQSMLIPMIVRLSKQEYAAYEENQEALQKAGFDLEPFGDDTLQMRGVPIILGTPQAEKCLLEALDSLMDGSGNLPDRTSRVIQMACKHAVKGGERLPEESVKQLIQDVIDQKVTPTCPHGRPLMIQLSHTELDKRFRRIQS